MIYETDYSLFLKEDVEFRDMLLKLSKNINTALCRGGYEKLHNDYSLKPYTFSNLFPITFDFYRKNKVYKFCFRTLNPEISFVLEDNFKNNRLFDVVSKKTVYKPYIIYLIDELVFYAIGNKEGIESLLGEVNSLGGKRKFGHGLVENIRVEEVSDCKIFRRVPYKTQGIPGRIKPPYWANNDWNLYKEEYII